MRWMILVFGLWGAVLAAAPAHAAACCARPSAPASRPAGANAAETTGETSASARGAMGETYVALYHVTGRTCAACDRSIERALLRVEGIRSVRFDGDTLIVVAARDLSETQIVRAVASAGGDRHAFHATPVSRRGATLDPRPSAPPDRARRSRDGESGR